MRELDARGLSCPQPVLDTKKALSEIPEGTITVIVDNPESKENVRRFALREAKALTQSAAVPQWLVSAACVTWACAKTAPDIARNAPKSAARKR